MSYALIKGFIFLIFIWQGVIWALGLRFKAAGKEEKEKSERTRRRHETDEMLVYDPQHGGPHPRQGLSPHPCSCHPPSGPPPSLSRLIQKNTPSLQPPPKFSGLCLILRSFPWLDPEPSVLVLVRVSTLPYFQETFQTYMPTRAMRSASYRLFGYPFSSHPSGHRSTLTSAGGWKSLKTHITTSPCWLFLHAAAVLF